MIETLPTSPLRHFVFTNLGVVQPPIHGVLRPSGPRGAAPMRVKLNQSESVVP